MNDQTLQKIAESLIQQLLSASTPEERVIVTDEIGDSCHEVISVVVMMLSEAIAPVFSEPGAAWSLS